MKTFFMLTVILFFAGIFFIIGCKKDPTGPSPIKNPSEYTWTVDTLAYPGSLQTLMRAIWGSSSSNIYICGHNDQRFAKMYHWDGKSWTNVKLHVTEGGTLNSVGSLKGIFGFSAQNMYAVGDIGPQFNPFLIHYNGSLWQEITVPEGQGLQSIWGRSPTEIWIGGLEGFLSRYNGTQFTRDSFPCTFDTLGVNIQVSQITGSATTTHLVLSVSPDTLFAPIYYFYERINSLWQVRDSSYEFARIFVAPKGTVYRYGYNGVQRKDRNNWITALPNLTVGRNGMSASGESNIFVVGFAGSLPTGRVYHYNGTDWFEYTKLRMDGVDFQAV